MTSTVWRFPLLSQAPSHDGVVWLGGQKWQLRSIGGDNTVRPLGFVHLHDGRYEVIRPGAEPTRVFYASAREAFEHFLPYGAKTDLRR